jgi:hypothetical protein
MVILPMVAQVAADEPETAAKNGAAQPSRSTKVLNV